jgi:hypothetical protein
MLNAKNLLMRCNEKPYFLEGKEVTQQGTLAI